MTHGRDGMKMTHGMDGVKIIRGMINGRLARGRDGMRTISGLTSETIVITMLTENRSVVEIPVAADYPLAQRIKTELKQRQIETTNQRLCLADSNARTKITSMTKNLTAQTAEINIINVARHES